MNAGLFLALTAFGNSTPSPVLDERGPVALHQDTKPAKPDEKKQEEKKDPYQDAIKDMKKAEGMVTVFTKDDNVLFQIPASLMGKDILWTTELKETPTGMFNGTFLTTGVVRFEQRGEKVFIRSVGHNVIASEGDEIKRGVDQSNADPIIKSFPVKAKAPNGAPLIDVGTYFKGDIPEFSTKASLGGAMIDPERSYYNAVKVFPTNVNIEVTQTAAGGGGGGRGFFGGAPARPANTGVVLHSLVVLPEKPMMGRLWDSRVGYFDNSYSDYGTKKHGVKQFRYINRYRLEKKDPNAAVSDPVKPIVYYIAPEVPAQWREYVRKGVEDWQPAFEAAGFSNAIVCKDPPKDDPNWDPEDARYSVVRWAPLPIANAMGPSVTDPRSGEIVSAHIIMWHDILKLQTEWYFSQAAASDPRAQRLPLPDDLMGECVRFVVAHEVGHTLGLPHNGKSSAMIPTKLLRDPKWTHENGTCTSIMDYARFNYVAQPGDGANLIPIVGRYDKFSIMWGYKPIDGARHPEDEKRTLDQWASRQVGDPMLRFYDNFSGSDPTAQSEALGDNAIEASNYGILNLKRIIGFLIPAATKFGEDYTELGEAHGALTSQFFNYIFHVSTVIGGVVQTDYHAGRGDTVYKPCDKAYQKSAAKWLLTNAVDAPLWLFPDSVMLRKGSQTGANAAQGIQRMALSAMLSNSRLTRMLDNETANGAKAYTVGEYLQDIRSNVFRELSTGSAVGFNRRNSQREYVKTLTAKMGSSSEIRIHAMAELKMVTAMIKSAVPRTKDAVTVAHLEDMRKQAEFVLANPDKGATAPVTAADFPFLKSIKSGGCSHAKSVDYDEWFK